MILYPDPGIESSVLAGHEDSVWGLTYSAVHHRLASCSADGTIRIWDPQNSSPCMSVFNKERGRHLSWLCGFALALFLFRSHILITFHCLFGFLCLCVCVCVFHLFIYLFFLEHGTPTSVAFVATDPNQVVVSFDGGETLLYDLNTEQSVTMLDTQTKDGMFWMQSPT